jgi:hypothetical protein
MIGVRGFFVKTEQGKKRPGYIQAQWRENRPENAISSGLSVHNPSGVTAFYCCAVQVHDNRKQTEDRAAGEPTLGPSFQVKSSDKPTISPKIPQISADNAPKSTQPDSPIIHHCHPLPLVDCVLPEAALGHLRTPFESIEERNDLSMDLGDELRQCGGEIFRFAT